MTSIADAASIAHERATETEQLGRLHPEVVGALTDSGSFRHWVAADVGGPAVPIGETLHAIAEISRADAAAGWCVMIANTTALVSHRLPHEWAKVIYGDPLACTGGFAMPSGVGRVVDGGLRVTGSWGWGSGTDHCTWIGGGVTIVDSDGNPATTKDGATAPFVIFEPSQVELLDTWQVTGLKGTASTDYAVTDAFVPEGRWAQFIAATPRTDEPHARFPFFGALATGIASVLIGLAERAIDELIELGTKTSLGSSRPLSLRSAAQTDLALAMAGVRQARALLDDAVEVAWDEAIQGRPMSDERKVGLRLAATTAAIRCLESVDICNAAAGGAAVYERNPMQRVFRDAHVAASHGMVARRTLEPLGRFLFGEPTDTTFL